MNEHPRDEKAVFFAALKQATPPEREAYVQDACGADVELLERVQMLLEAHNESVGPLDAPPPGIDPSAITDQPIDDQSGSQIGPYRLLEPLGEGGFGVVYLAEQTEPIQRRVALKIIKLGMDTQAVIARFEAERQALAMMEHPHIAKVLDAGATETGRPYFVMELVHGLPITEHCDEHHFTTRERLELFVKVCDAVRHAHERGIIHRDIKPSNVMVTIRDGEAVPKVIDFGIAKATDQRLTERTVATEQGQLIGTPQYMSPEQADFSGPDVDTRSDVYSLGVLLYELLVGTTPFEPEQLRDVGYDRVCQIIRENEPPLPSKRLSTLGDATTEITAQRQTRPAELSRQLRGDLDVIVMKALEKDRRDRYATVAELSDDIRRCLLHEPIHARPPTLTTRISKWSRRHRTFVWAAAAVLLVALVALSVSTAMIAGALGQARDALADTEVERDNANTARLDAEQQRKLAFAMLELAVKDFRPVGAVFGPDGHFYVCSGGTDRVVQFDGKSGRFMREFVAAGSGGLKSPEGLAFGPDINDDNTAELYVASLDNHAVLRYDGATGAFIDAVVSPRSGGLTHPTGLVFGPDTHLYVASFTTDSILRYDGRTGDFLDEFVPSSSGGLRRPQTPLFGPDGHLYVASFNTHSILRYDGSTGQFIDAFVPSRRGRLQWPEGLAFGSNGDLYVISSGPSRVLRYDGDTGEFINEFIPSSGSSLGAQTLVFDADGTLYVTSYSTDSVSRFDGVTGAFIDFFATYDRSLFVESSRAGQSLSARVRYSLSRADDYRKSGNDKMAIETIRDTASRIVASTPERRQELARAYFSAGDALFHEGDYNGGVQVFNQAILLEPEDGFIQSQVAFHLLTCPDEKYRDLAKAAELARRGTQLSPEVAWNWMVLGITQYRHGEFRDARTSLLKLVELDADTAHPRTSCFLSMACWQLGEKELARQHYDDAVEWIEKNENENEITLGFRDEAAELLGSDTNQPKPEENPSE